MAEADLVSIPGGKMTDEERGAMIRAELRPVLEQACDIITKARRDGINIGFNLGPDQFGVQRITSLDLFKAI